MEFSPLDFNTMTRIVKLEIDNLNRQLEGKKVVINVSPSAMEYIAAVSMDENAGARQISKIIDAKIKEPLTDEILFGKLKRGGTVVVEKKRERLTLMVEGC